MENTPVQPINNPQGNNIQSPTTPVMPPAPQNPTPEFTPPNKSVKPLLIVLASIGFLSIAGVTGYLYIHNQNELDVLNQTSSTPIQNASPAPASKEVENMVLAENVECARFTRLENALEYPEKACILDLSGQNLSSVPEEVYDLPNLNELNLSNNNLTSFPVEAVNIKNIVFLDLSNNKISSIPDEIPNNENTVGVEVDENGEESLYIIPFPQILKLQGNPLPAETISLYERGN